MASPKTASEANQKAYGAKIYLVNATKPIQWQSQGNSKHLSDWREAPLSPKRGAQHKGDLDPKWYCASPKYPMV